MFLEMSSSPPDLFPSFLRQEYTAIDNFFESRPVSEGTMRLSLAASGNNAVAPRRHHHKGKTSIRVPFPQIVHDPPRSSSFNFLKLPMHIRDMIIREATRLESDIEKFWNLDFKCNDDPWKSSYKTVLALSQTSKKLRNHMLDSMKGPIYNRSNQIMDLYRDLREENQRVLRAEEEDKSRQLDTRSLGFLAYFELTNMHMMYAYHKMYKYCRRARGYDSPQFGDLDLETWLIETEEIFNEWSDSLFFSKWSQVWVNHKAGKNIQTRPGRWGPAAVLGMRW